MTAIEENLISKEKVAVVPKYRHRPWNFPWLNWGLAHFSVCDTVRIQSFLADQNSEISTTNPDPNLIDHLYLFLFIVLFQKFLHKVVHLYVIIISLHVYIYFGFQYTVLY